MAMVCCNKDAARETTSCQGAEFLTSVKDRLGRLIRLGRQFRRVNLQIQSFVALKAGKKP